MKRLLWLDLETTGRNPRWDHILQVAVARTDDVGEIIEAREWVVSSDIEDREMPQVVLKMHTKSGLLARVRGSEARYMFEVEAELVEFIGPGKPVIAGNNIGFDRGFITVKFPRADDALHYRAFDVSTLKMFAAMRGLPEYKKTKKHLALDDVKASIAEFLHWKKEFGR